MRRGAPATMILIAVSCGSPNAQNGGEGGANGAPACAERGTPRVVEDANAAASWVETRLWLELKDPGFDFTRLNAGTAARAAAIEERKAQLAPVYAPIVERLRALGAREIDDGRWLGCGVGAIVLARHAAEIACWPEVVGLSPSVGIVCADTCTLECAREPPESCGTCATVVADRIDRVRGCRVARVPLACNEPHGSDILTCYVRASTGEVFASRDPLLVARQVPDLRLCSREEGGADPATLPVCP